MALRSTPRAVALLAAPVLAATLLGAGHAAADASTIGSDGYVHVAPNGVVLGVDPYYPKDGNGGYDVSDYTLALDYSPYWGTLRGKATIKAVTTQDLSRFNLDLRGMTVRSVRVNGAPAAFTRVGEHELVITPSALLPSGADFTVEVGYDGVPRPLYTSRGWTGWVDTGDSAVAMGAPRAAMTWFPVNGTEVDKATMHVAVTVPTGWSVVGNGVQASDVPGSGRHTVTWAEETPLAPHATMLGIGRWQLDTITLADGTKAVNAYGPCALGLRAVGNRLPEVREFLDPLLWGYPQSASGTLFLDRNTAYTHGAQGRPVLGANATVEDLVYATAYQWWGASLTHKMWKDVLLVEGFSRYAVWLWDEAKNGVDLDARYRGLVERGDAAFWARRLIDPGAGREFAPTTKAVLMVHALRKTLGDDLFFQVMAGFPIINQQGNQNWHDWELYVDAVAQRELTGFYHAWLEGAVIPPAEFLYPTAP
ncbi:peptidase M1 [Actinokineospora fastidiosa]|uniref:Peptidase n=1 Tax=Actinokineospora fastidiosa TaxID=1816 RepID=A0A918GEF0_9PSEU|nr:peptidase M1 [Actinokineospora fastidiosa]GGS32448.1 peptidase [Actinokineospora fastidiosa]